MEIITDIRPDKKSGSSENKEFRHSIFSGGLKNKSFEYNNKTISKANNKILGILRLILSKIIVNMYFTSFQEP
jgi:hypothetical protein